MSQNTRVAELHRLARQDYAKGQQERAAIPNLFPSYTPGVHVPEPSDLDVAIRVAQQFLDSDQILSMREALRLLLRALHAEPDSRSEGWTCETHVRLPGASQKVPDTGELPEPLYGGDVDQFISDAYDSLADSDLDDEPDRCQAAHPKDPTPCVGPPVVTVLDAVNEGADGCEHHGARLLASLDRGRVYPLPDAPEGAAIRVFKAADTIRPFCWVDGPRTRDEQLSRAETRARGERP
jgi:predicted nucleotidyltransferase